MLLAGRREESGQGAAGPLERGAEATAWRREDGQRAQAAVARLGWLSEGISRCGRAETGLASAAWAVTAALMGRVLRLPDPPAQPAVRIKGDPRSTSTRARSSSCGQLWLEQLQSLARSAAPCSTRRCDRSAPVPQRARPAPPPLTARSTAAGASGWSAAAQPAAAHCGFKGQGTIAASPPTCDAGSRHSWHHGQATLHRGSALPGAVCGSRSAGCADRQVALLIAGLGAGACLTVCVQVFVLCKLQQFSRCQVAQLA